MSWCWQGKARAACSLGVVHASWNMNIGCPSQAHATVGQVKARLALSERELVLARQEAEGSSKSGTALGQELHAVKRHSQALQQQLTSLQAELEETLDKQQVEVSVAGHKLWRTDS